MLFILLKAPSVILKMVYLSEDLSNKKLSIIEETFKFLEFQKKHIFSMDLEIQDN